MQNPYHYRNKVKLPVRYDGESLVTGLYASDTNRLVYIDECLIEKEDLRKAVDEICKHLTKYQVIAYNPRLHDGILRHIVARSSKLTGEIQVTLILYKRDQRTINIAKDLIKIEHIESVYISINDDFNINFSDYNKVVTNFKNQYPVDVDGNLIITVNVNINGEKEGINEDIKNNYDLKVIVPLGKETTEIKDFITTIDNNGSINNYEKTKEGYTLFSLLCDIVYKLDILYVIFVFVFIFKIMPKMSGYNLELKRVLKEYDKMIVNVNSMPELGDLQVMEVSNFDELVDAKKNLNKPIMYFDNYDKNEVIFVVKSDSDAFVYIMNKYDK